MNIKVLKRKIGIIINKSPLRPIFELVNMVLFHWKDRMYKEKRNAKGGTVLIIRPLTDSQGLLSSFLYVLKYVRWAENKGWTVYVDFESDKCQYYTGELVYGSKNAWEYYFEQPFGLCKSDLDQASEIVYSGWSLSNYYNPTPIPKRPEVATDNEIVRLARDKCRVKKYIIEIVDKKYKELFSENVLGVFIRGTDYIKIKPKGHAIQPSIYEIIRKIDEFLENYDCIDKIYVVTEDDSYYQELKNKYGDMVFSSDDYFIQEYKGNNYIESAFLNDPYERGLNYLVRILLFGRCNYTISGITNGSVVSNIIKEKDPIDSYWFDLGLYN